MQTIHEIFKVKVKGKGQGHRKGQKWKIVITSSKIYFNFLLYFCIFLWPNLVRLMYHTWYFALISSFPVEVEKLGVRRKFVFFTIRRLWEVMLTSRWPKLHTPLIFQTQIVSSNFKVTGQRSRSRSSNEILAMMRDRPFSQYKIDHEMRNIWYVFMKLSHYIQACNWLRIFKLHEERSKVNVTMTWKVKTNICL